MVEFDTSKRKNRWIEVVAVRWGNKLGRRCLALLNIKMYYACSLAKRKRDAPTYEDSFSSIVVDENNAVKASSKLLKLFIFFWDLNLDAALKREQTKVLLSRKLKKINFDTHLLTLLLRLLFNIRWKYWRLYLQIVLELVPLKMNNSLYHITHQVASILTKCTHLLVKNISMKPNGALKSQGTWGIFVILHQSYFLTTVTFAISFFLLLLNCTQMALWEHCSIK